MTSRRTLTVLGAAIVALLVAVLVVGVMILNSMNAPSTEEREASCMSEQGYPLDVAPKDIEGFTMEGLREASEACGLD